MFIVHRVIDGYSNNKILWTIKTRKYWAPCQHLLSSGLAWQWNVGQIDPHTCRNYTGFIKQKLFQIKKKGEVEWENTL